MKQLTCLIAMVAIGCSASTTDAPEIPSWSRSEHAFEPAGRDALNCWKVAMSEVEWQKTVLSLQLKAMDSYPEHDTPSANCNTDWWDVDLPKQAKNYWISKEGHIRRLALYKDGNLYFTDEIR